MDLIASQEEKRIKIKQKQTPASSFQWILGCIHPNIGLSWRDVLIGREEEEKRSLEGLPDEGWWAGHMPTPASAFCLFFMQEFQQTKSKSMFHLGWFVVQSFFFMLIFTFIFFSRL